MRVKCLFALALSVLLALPSGCSYAGSAKTKNFPTKPIDMTILFGAGGGADVLGRKLADLASKELGQPIVANNRTGGGGAIGYQYVLNSEPNGYNIVWNSTSISVTYHQGNMPKGQDYSAFRGIAKITDEATALAVKADARWKNLDEFIAYCKAHPGEVTVANSGVGSFTHLSAALIEEAAGVKFKHVPMGAKQSTTALVGGRVDAMVNMAFDVIQQVNAGTVKALAVVSDSRLDQLKDVPTMKEKGYDVDLMMYRGIAVPRNTPDNVVEILEKAFVKAGKSDEFKKFAAKYGVIVKVLGAKEFDTYMREQDLQVEKAMELIGMKKQ